MSTCCREILSRGIIQVVFAFLGEVWNLQKQSETNAAYLKITVTNKHRVGEQDRHNLLYSNAPGQDLKHKTLVLAIYLTESAYSSALT